MKFDFIKESMKKNWNGMVATPKIIVQGGPLRSVV